MKECSIYRGEITYPQFTHISFHFFRGEITPCNTDRLGGPSLQQISGLPEGRPGFCTLATEFSVVLGRPVLGASNALKMAVFCC